VKFSVYYRINCNTVLSKPLMDRQAKLLKKFTRQKPDAEFTEIETLSRNRPVLAKAVKFCADQDMVLVIPRSDGLNLKSVLKRVKVFCLDYSFEPVGSAEEVQLHHRDIRSNRAYAGMLAAKAKGLKLAAQHPKVAKGRDKCKAWVKASKVASKVNRQRRAEAYKGLRPKLLEMRKYGMTLQQIADSLNGTGHLTSRGKPFTPVAVRRVLIYDSKNRG
jgi:hypothetical protein